MNDTKMHLIVKHMPIIRDNTGTTCVVEAAWLSCPGALRSARQTRTRSPGWCCCYTAVRKIAENHGEILVIRPCRWPWSTPRSPVYLFSVWWWESTTEHKAGGEIRNTTREAAFSRWSRVTIFNSAITSWMRNIHRYTCRQIHAYSLHTYTYIYVHKNIGIHT